MNFKVNESKQKLSGAYYTPPHIAAFLARWVLESKPKRLLEPSCGDGALIAALASAGLSRSAHITACELAPEEASKTVHLADDLGLRNAQVVRSDFVEWAMQAIQGGVSFDAAMGNPPFVRYQYIDRGVQDRMEQLFGLLRIPFTRHTNLWVPFILASLRLLREGGRLAFVVPAELLHVLHAEPLRDYLAKNCREIVVVDPADIWFGETLQGVVLLMAEKRRSADNPFANLEIVSLANRHQLYTSLESLRNPANATSTSGLGPKWVGALLTPSERETFRWFSTQPCVREFHDLASAEVGIVTGANKFFFVTDHVVQEFGLRRWSRPMMGRSEHLEGVVYDAEQHERNRQKGLPTNFLDFDVPFFRRVPEDVSRYVQTGEAEGLHRRYKCRIREPWYVVPSVYSTPVGLLKRSHHLPKLFLNEAEVLTTDTAYRVRPRGVSSISLVTSFVNSLTALSAELEGRHYGGGVLELVPSEIERLLVPLAEFSNVELLRLDKSMKNVGQPVTLLERRDKIIARKLKLDSQAFDVVRGAYNRLRGRRMRLPLPAAEEDQ